MGALAAHLLSAAYELWRATARAGVSKHDSMRSFLRQDLPLYAVAAVVIGPLFAGVGPAAWLGLGFCIVVILASIFVYNPKFLLAPQPGARRLVRRPHLHRPALRRSHRAVLRDHGKHPGALNARVTPRVTGRPGSRLLPGFTPGIRRTVVLAWRATRVAAAG